MARIDDKFNKISKEYDNEMAESTSHIKNKPATPFMLQAIEEARTGINSNHGGPFGCIIVKNGQIIGRGHNQVVLNKDATCHGEIQAIRDASKTLNSFDLTGCELYTTGEPCSMCLSACIWANISKVFYGAKLEDNELIGFRDVKIDKMLGGRKNLPFTYKELNRKECLKLFEEYKNLKNKTNY